MVFEDGQHKYKLISSLGIRCLLCLKELGSFFPSRIYKFWTDIMNVNKPVNLISQDEKIRTTH